MDDNMNISGGTPENTDSFGDTAGVWDSLTGDAPAAHNDTQETVQPDTAQDTASAEDAQTEQPQSADMGAQSANGMPAGGAQAAQAAPQGGGGLLSALSSLLGGGQQDPGPQAAGADDAAINGGDLLSALLGLK